MTVIWRAYGLVVFVLFFFRRADFWCFSNMFNVILDTNADIES